MRIAQIVTTELAKEKLMLEERLENAINSDIDIEDKLKLIKKTLKKIVLYEDMFVKWQLYITPFKQNDSEENNDLEVNK